MVQFLFEQHALRGQSYADIRQLLPEGVSLLGEAIKNLNRGMARFLVEEMGGGGEQLPSKYTGLEHLASPHYAAIFFDDSHVFDYLLRTVNLDMKALEECLRHVISQASARRGRGLSMYWLMEALTARLGPDICRSFKEREDIKAILQSSCPSIFEYFNECKYEEDIKLVTPIDDMAEQLFDYIKEKPVSKCIALMEEGPLSRIPGFWQSIKGCQTLRRAAEYAVNELSLPMLKYLMETYNVPGHGLFEQEKQARELLEDTE